MIAKVSALKVKYLLTCFCFGFSEISPHRDIVVTRCEVSGNIVFRRTMLVFSNEISEISKSNNFEELRTRGIWLRVTEWCEGEVKIPFPL